jgi:SPOR domain
MADRYQDQPFPTDDQYDHGGNPNGKAESDPLAELARLIGQTDPFVATPKAPAPHPLQSRANVRAQRPYQPQAEEDEVATRAGPPPWMQRARQEVPPPAPAPQQDYEEPDYQPSPVHPLHRYAAQHLAPAPEPEYREDLSFPNAGQEPDQSRYDEALYGQIESGEQDFQRDPAYPDDPYAYQSDYADEEPAPRKRSTGLMTVAAVLALAVVGTGAAFAYRTYVGSPRTGEPPIIKADNSPTKIVPAPADSVAKTPDRMVPSDGTEKLVSREEAPVDVNAKTGGPRVVFPPLNPNGSPPPMASVGPQPMQAPPTASGTMPNTEPRKIKTLSVKGDVADAGVPAAALPSPAKPGRNAATPAAAPRNANASANAPMSLTPAAPPDPAAEAPTRTASTNAAPAASGGGYVVQVSSQKNEAEAQASYRALQSKFPSVLGSRAPLIKRADLGEKGVYYRAMVGPFGSPDEASQFCGSLKSAGGQCVVQRN